MSDTSAFRTVRFPVHRNGGYETSSVDAHIDNLLSALEDAYGDVKDLTQALRISRNELEDTQQTVTELRRDLQASRERAEKVESDAREAIMRLKAQLGN